MWSLTRLNNQLMASASRERVKVGFTGTRKGLSEQQRGALIFLLSDPAIVQFHHGDCKGADAQAHAIARKLHIPIAIHPPEEDRDRARCSVSAVDGGVVYPTRPYLDRNRDIVEAVHVLIACPGQKGQLFRGSGTWATIRLARDLHKRLRIIYPDGDESWNPS